MRALALSAAFIVAMISMADAEEFKLYLKIGKGARCSGMCDAFRDLVFGLCFEKRFGTANTKNCNCLEGNNAIVYGDVECSSRLADDETGGLASTRWYFWRDRDCEAEPLIEQIVNECKRIGYREGHLVQQVRCYFAPQNATKVASYLCKRK